jgi:hypothetical protein
LVSRNPTVWKHKKGLLYSAEFGEIELSNGDTVTFSNFDSSENLLEAYFIKKTDGLEMTCTHAAANVVTVTGAGTNIDCLYIVYGAKA